MRWNDEKSRRFQVLREAEVGGTLTDPERIELSALLADLDADEADDLHLATKQATDRAAELAAEKERLESQADELERLAVEQERLLTDATTYLQKLRDRSAALAEDFRRITGHDLATAR